MKTSKKLIRILLLICAVSIILCSCAKGNKFKFSDEGLVDKKTDVVYLDAPDCYSPIAVSDKVYGHSGEYRFYEIIGVSPERFVAEASGIVLYSSDINLPEIDDMHIMYMDICTETTDVKVNKTVEDKAAINEIVESYLTETPIYYLNLEPSLMYEIRFADTSIGIYYTLTYLRYDSGYAEYGTDFIYNRSAQRFVKAPDVLVDIINGLA